MKRVLFIVTAFVLFGGLLVCCNPENFGAGGYSNIPTKDFKFGYYKELTTPSSVLEQMTKLLKFLSFTDDQNRTFISFLSCEELDDIRNGKYKGYISNPKNFKEELVNTDEYKNSYVEWTQRGYFDVQPYPQGGKIFSVEVTSSNTDIISIIGPEYDKSGKVVKPERIYYSCNGIGTDTLTVSVKGLGFERTRQYPIDVVATIKTKFIITNNVVAASNKGCRLWMFFSHVPPPALDAVVKVTDSVTVTSYAEYYNFHKFGHALQAYRDTVTLRSKEMYFLPSLMRLWLLRELTIPYIELQGVHFFSLAPNYPWYAPFVPPLHKTVSSEKINVVQVPYYNSDKQQIGYHIIRDTVTVPVVIHVDQTMLSLEMASDNPYILFENGSFAFFSKDKSELDTDGWTVGKDSLDMSVSNLDEHVVITDSDHPLSAEELELGNGSVEETTRVPTSCFSIHLLENFNKHKRDSLKDAINDFKRDSGYNDSVSGSQDEACHYQDSVLNKINYKDV